MSTFYFLDWTAYLIKPSRQEFILIDFFLVTHVKLSRWRWNDPLQNEILLLCLNSGGVSYYIVNLQSN